MRQETVIISSLNVRKNNANLTWLVNQKTFNVIASWREIGRDQFCEEYILDISYGNRK